MVDLLVVGLDLETGQEVHAGHRESWEWWPKGHNGNKTLVCLQCYTGADLPGGQREVALVPKGRRGGVRRSHFAHPPGTAPPRGRHSRESIWHAESKQRLRRWAAGQGAAARVEACTPDRRRRSDVAVTLPDGHQVAIEVQLGAVSDAEWLARHQDYARAGIVDVWLWHSATWVPRVMFETGQPGWILDLDNDKLGLLYARPDPVPDAALPPGSSGCREVHWPPCPSDQLDTLWMPLGSAQLSPEGIRPSSEAPAQIARRATAAGATAGRASRHAQAGTRQDRNSKCPRTTPGMPVAEPNIRQRTQIHQAFRYDARPPWTDPDTWWYLCHACGRSRITGAELKASPIIHIVPTLERLTSTGKPLVSYVQHGGTAAPVPEEERPANPWAEPGA